jgi:hypothetical protein
MTMRFAPLAHLRSTQPTSHLQEYSAADELDAAVARGEQVSYRMRTEMRAQAGDAAHQVLEAIQILVNVHGAAASPNPAQCNSSGAKRRPAHRAEQHHRVQGLRQGAARHRRGRHPDGLTAQASGEVHSSRAAFPAGTTPFPLR